MDAVVGNVESAQPVVGRLHEAGRAAEIEVIVTERQRGLEQFDANTPLLVVVAAKHRRARLTERGPGLMLLVMFDEETEGLAKELKQKIALPPAKLRKHIDSKIVTTQLGNEAGIKSAPNTLGKAKTYDELLKLAAKAKLGKDLVVQTPYGDSGRTTFFVKSAADFAKNADKLTTEELKIMRRINHLPGTLEAVATRHGVPLATAALHFAAAHPAVSSLVLGAVSPDEVARNLAGFATPVPPALWGELRAEGLIRPDAPVPGSAA